MSAKQGIAGSADLARNALGLRQVLFCIVTGSAPIAAMMFNDPLGIRGVGIALPAAFILATIAYTFFSVGYIEMARRVTTAGGMYSYMSYGFGRVIGLATAGSLVVAYILFAAGVNGVTAYFAQTSIADLTGANIDWRIWTFVFIALMLVITYFSVEFVAKVLAVALAGELLVLMIFGIAVLVQGGGPDGLVWEALNPGAIFGGAGVEGADRVFAGVGGAAVGVGLFAAFWSWVGFEMAPNYAEEARNPKKMMAVAIYASAIGLGVMYTFWSWMLVSAYGSGKDQALWAVAAQWGIDAENGPTNAGFPDGNFASVFYPVANEFAGAGVEGALKILIITGSFACGLAFWNTACRYLFSMGRERILPSMLGRTHTTHKSPFVAALVVCVACVILDGMFAAGLAGTGFQTTLGIDESNPLVALLEVGTWLPFQGNMLLLPIMAGVNIAILVYFLRPANRDGFHWFKTLVAPIIGAAAIGYGFYLMIANRAFLTTGELSGWTLAVPYISLGIFAAGGLLAGLYYVRARDRYDAVGKFVHEEA